MIILLPFGHFLFGILSFLWRRYVGQIICIALVIDAGFIGSLWSEILMGQPISIVLGGWTRQVGIEIVADTVSLALSTLALLLAIAVTAYTWRQRARPHFFVLIHFLLASVYALVSAKDLFNIYVILELLTLVSFLLVGYERKARQIWASLNYLVLAALGMAIYLFGVGITYYHTGTLNLTVLAKVIGEEHGEIWLILASTLLVTGVAVKAGVFLFSLWLPAAHASASHGVSALLSGLVIKMGVVVLLRLSLVFEISLPLIVMGGLTGILGAIYAMFTYELKRMLAFSTLSQVGCLLIGIGIGTPIAIAGSISYAVGHGLFKGLLFLASGQVVRATGSAFIPQQIFAKEKVPRSTRIALLVGTLAIAGFPPLAGFCAKGLLGACTTSPPIFLLLVVISLGTVISFSKIVPLLDPRAGPAEDKTKAISYVALALPIAAFLPISLLFVPRTEAFSLLGFRQIGDSLAIIVIGYLIYCCIRSYRVHLPQRIFRLEEAMLVVLSMFFVTFLLLAV
jgi:multicomponent Na+:H+ antiporter subunit D